MHFSCLSFLFEDKNNYNFWLKRTNKIVILLKLYLENKSMLNC